MDEIMCREWILSQEYWDFIIPGYRELSDLDLEETEVCSQKMGFGYRSYYVKNRPLEPLSIDRYFYNTIPNCYALLDLEALNASGISAVQNYPGLQLMGEDVLIGFIDTGIDYTNDVFKRIDGNTKIVGIWDQTIQEGAAPEGFAYGSEYRESAINEALRTQNPMDIVPSMDTNGHGTFLASVAAGSGNVENRFLGAAPEASIAVVKLKEAKEYLKEFYSIKKDAVCFQENDIMLGLRYLDNLAEELGMPIIMCIALGSNFGGHNSSTLLSDVLNIYSSLQGRGVVIGGGNEANQRHHYSNVITDMRERREVEIRTGSRVEGFVAELWTTIPNLMTVSIVSPSGERSPRISVRQGNRFTYSFSFDRTKVVAEYRLLAENNDSQLIFLHFHTPAAGIWKIIVEPLQVSDGQFHIWLPMTEFLTDEVYFLEANPETTITEPSSTQNSITVSYYNAVDNSIDINSGRGYTRNGFIKPDFAAPGVDITGAGLQGRFVKRSGSSAAVGITAGAMALIMEWLDKQPSQLTPGTKQLRNLIVLGAEQKPFLTYPNTEWGYGTLDVYQALDLLRQL